MGFGLGVLAGLAAVLYFSMGFLFYVINLPLARTHMIFTWPIMLIYYLIKYR